ncbi:NAD(P)-dependent oxidoreductase [Candidatus Poribacteria bacterium]|nr:NAD(P)-dependent oxidoreductase [Candidatus Poribacteria bacterium]
MNVLITSAASELSKRLAIAASDSHTIRLTELQPIETDFDFTQGDLGHDESTNELVKGIDTIVHIAEIPTHILTSADQPENLQIDFQTRCTYNLLMAGSEEGVKQFIYASTLRLFDNHDEDWTVKENWRPRPTTDSYVLSKHLGEFTCREFSREGKIKVSILRLGTLKTSEEVKKGEIDTMCLELNDAVSAFQGAIDAPSKWGIFHIQSEFSGSRFDIGNAKSHLNYEPKFDPTV